MSDKQPPKANGSSEATKSYEENAEDQQGLIEAAAAVPLKDYSNYEMTIETKDEYTDALFADEGELDTALHQAEEEKLQPTTPSTPPKPSNIEAEPAQVKIDFTALLSEQSRAGAFSSNTDQTPGKLSIINNSLNHSPARKTLPGNETAAAFEQALKDIVADIAREEQLAREEKAKALEPEDTPTADGSKLSTITQKLKAKGKALSKKGLARMDQSKAELDEYLGRTLPERTLALEFILPTIKAKKEQDHLSTEKEIAKLFNTKGKPPASVLIKAEQDLLTLSKSSLSNSKRLSLLNTYFPPLSDKIKSLIAMIERKPSIYEDEKRSSMVDSALSCIKHLTTGYKQIYADLYESSNVVYGPQRKTANQVAFLMADCLYLEQLLSIALHTRMPGSSIKTFNKLFHILSRYEPELLEQESQAFSVSEPVSINHLYRNYQVFALLDYFSISTADQRVLHTYLKQYYSLIEVIPLQLSSRLSAIEPGQQLLATEHDRSEGALVISSVTAIGQQHEQQHSIIYLTVQALFNQIKTDYVSALKLRINQRSRHSDPALKDQPIEQVLSILAALNLSIRQAEAGTSAPVYTLYKGIEIKAYSGLQDIIAFNHYDYALQQKGQLQKGQPAGDLPPKPPASKSVWQCAMEDSNALYLQTTEAKLGIPMDVGRMVQLIKTVKIEDEDSNETSTEETLLVVISKLERTTQGRIILVADIIGTEFTVVNDQNNESILAIKDHQSLLVSAPGQQYWSHQSHDISFFNKGQATISVSGLSHCSTDAQILQLN